MSRQVITIPADASVRELARILRKHGISGVPVVEADGEVVGTVSITDILWFSDRLLPLPDERSEGGSRSEVVDPGSVREIMTADVFGLPPTASTRELVEFISRTGLHRVPVLEAGKVVGIVSASDLLDLVAGRSESDGADGSE